MSEQQPLDDKGIQFHDDEERALFEEARLGQMAIDFLTTPLGKWLRGVAEQEKQDAMERLLAADFNDAMTIAKAQMEATIADNFVHWIGEAIQNGHHAEQQLNDLYDED